MHDSERFDALPLLLISIIPLLGVLSEWVSGKTFFQAVVSVVQPWINWLALSIAGVVGTYFTCELTIDHHKNSKKMADWLREDVLTRGYRRALSWTLSAFDRVWSPSAEPNREHNSEIQRAWSFGLANFCFCAAIVYPTVFLTSQWAITGEAARLGSLEIIGGRGNLLQRITVFTAMIVFCGTLIWVSKYKNKTLSLSLLVGKPKSIFVLIAGLIIACTALLHSALEAVVLAGLACTFVFAVVTPGALSIVISAIIAAGANVPLMFVAIATFVAQLRLGQRYKCPTAALLVYVVILFGMIALGSSLLIDRSSAQAKLLIFVGFFPILIGLFDFASIGFTRYRLRIGLLQASGSREAMVDFVGGCALLVLLVIVTIAIYSITYDKNGFLLIDTTEVLEQIKSEPQSHFWLFLTFSLTMFPTFLHFSFTIVTWFTTTYPGVLRWLSDLVEKNADHPGMVAVLVPIFSMLAYIAIAVPLVVFNSLYLLIIAFGLDISIFCIDTLLIFAKAIRG